MWGERFVCITGRLQRMMSWQAEMFVYEMALTPEFKEVIGNHQVMAEGVRRFGAGVEAWPAALARERAALLKGLEDQTGAAGEVGSSAAVRLGSGTP